MRTSTPPAPDAGAPPRTNAEWRSVLAPYSRASVPHAALDVLTSIVPYVALFVAMYLSLEVSYLLTLALAIPASGFLLRTYIVFHDTTHGSFLPWRWANHLLGVVAGLIVYTPYTSWRSDHAYHHATAGDLDRRGGGDVETMTVDEYLAAGRGRRAVYRLFRNPLVMFTLGPVVALVIQPRFVGRDKPARIKRSVHATNVTLALLIAGLCVLMGPVSFLLVQLPMVFLAGGAGVFLFYVQHQFEDVYWESGDRWSYADAALQGSSYLKLPKLLQYFSGNIGLHHVHHLNARIPNYRLQQAHDEVDVFHDVPVLTVWQGVRATRLKLWCRERQRLVTWAEVRPLLRAQADGAA
ncbi:MAG: fatty acid desaturase [Solirubrobacteraceae bacterium]|nr:fatty acid desaturase [Solirubrobacteraceae bacterium]